MVSVEGNVHSFRFGGAQARARSRCDSNRRSKQLEIPQWSYRNGRGQGEQLYVAVVYGLWICGGACGFLGGVRKSWFNTIARVTLSHEGTRRKLSKWAQGITVIWFFGKQLQSPGQLALPPGLAFPPAPWSPGGRTHAALFCPPLVRAFRIHL